MVDHDILIKQIHHLHTQNIINKETLTQLIFLLCNYRIGSNNIDS